MRSTNPRTSREIVSQSRNCSRCSPTDLAVVDGMAVLIEAREATHDVATKVDARMAHRTWDVPVVRRTDVRWTDGTGDREIATQVAAMGKARARARVREMVPEAGEKATVLKLAAETEVVEIHNEDHSRVVRLAVVIIANQTWLADAGPAARRHSLARNLVDRVDRLRLPVTRDVRHSVADHRSLAHLSSRREWDDHSRAVPDHRRSVVRKVDRLSIDPPGVDLTHVATVEMAPLKAVADVELARATVVAEAHRAAHRTDVEIEVRDRTHETAGATDRPTAAIADPNHVRVTVAAEAHRAARQTDVEIEAPDRMHEMVVVTGLHPELTERDDGDQTAIGVTPPDADQMAMLHETAATDDPTEIVDRTHGQTATGARSTRSGNGVIS